MPSPTPADLLALSTTDVRTPIPRSQLIPALAAPPFLYIDGTFNTRDLGGLPGSALRRGLAFRSGSLTGLTPDGAAALGALGVRRVFDLRSRAERAASGPDPAVPGAAAVWTSTAEADARVAAADFVAAEPAYAAMYIEVLRRYGGAVAAVLEQVRDRPGEAFLLHCTAGRDRTGVVAGLLLALAGEAADRVALDYMLSRVGTEPARERLIAFARREAGVEDEEAPGFYNLISLRLSCWEAFLEAVRVEYGGFDRYVVDTLGFSEEDLETIRRNLRAPVSS